MGNSIEILSRCIRPTQSFAIGRKIDMEHDGALVGTVTMTDTGESFIRHFLCLDLLSICPRFQPHFISPLATLAPSSSELASLRSG